MKLARRIIATAEDDILLETQNDSEEHSISVLFHNMNCN
jgi:hypothetical protein